MKPSILLASLLLALATHALAQPKPNIVLVLCDDLGYADVGFNGSTDITTPNLDDLAKNGTVFTSAYVVHPFCGPSRMGLFAGRYPHHFGAPFNLPNTGMGIEEYNRDGIPVDETLISTVLQDAGYHTGAVGKWHMGEAPPFHPNKRGFDDYFGFLGGGHKYFPHQFQPAYQRQVKNGNTDINDYLKPLERNGTPVEETEYITDALSREAVRFVRQAAGRDDPFFLYLAYNAPHSPLEATDDDLARFPDIKDEKRRTYAAMVYAVDRGVGQLVDALNQTGQLDDTLIVFLSDNGGKLSLGANNAPLREGKGSTHEGGYRVPMLFHWPKNIPAGKHYHHPVSALDFYPTFARLAGAPVPPNKHLDGLDIWDALLADRSPRPGQMIYTLRHRDGFSDVGARRDNWKITRTFRGPWQLFDIATDIGESRDLSARHPEVLGDMAATAKAWASTHQEVQPRWFDSLKAAAKWRDDDMPNYRSDFQVKQPDLPGGETVYTESFDHNPGYITADGPNENNISSVAFGAGNAGFPKIKPGQYAGTAQYLSGTTVTTSLDDGAFALGSDSKISGKSRNRSSLTIVDTSQLPTGQYRASFDVADLQSSAPDTRLYFHLYEGSNTNSGHIKFQLTSQKILPELASFRPLVTPGLGGTVYQASVDNEITGNGRFSVSFGLANAGKPGDFLALIWSQVKLKGNVPMPSMTIDNVELTRLTSPDPGTTSTSPPPAPLGKTGTWQLLADVSDEFDAQAIDPQKWNNNPGSWGAWSWDQTNTLQKDGKLHLRMVHEPHTRDGTRLFYKSGIVRSHHQMTYGYYEARIKACPLFPGACPSFWTYSDGRRYSGEVRYCEIDFVELLMNELDHATGERNPANFIDMNLHLRLADAAGDVSWLRPNSHPELCASHWTAPWDPRDDFHVYGCNVTRETITWYIDGQQVAQKPNKHWHLPMNVTLSLGLRHPHIGWVGQDMKPVPQAATPEGFPTSMQVDYVRVWQPN